VSLESDDLKIDPAYLNDASDWQDLETAVAWVREQFTPKLNRLGWTEVVPGKRGGSLRGLRRSISAYAQSIYHPTSTCPMAPPESEGVVDTDFRVYGFDNLRICDASTFPTIPASNTQAPTLHIARTLANLLTGR
ncbi:MAG TPA: GMC family oxidoreductase, partial [Planctomycetaceae bacterium]|nr:GMC family oxidoreductase [Planctomycetaceae bacterium]